MKSFRVPRGFKRIVKSFPEELRSEILSSDRSFLTIYGKHNLTFTYRTMPAQSTPSYQKDLYSRMGGEKAYEFAIMELSDRLLKDKSVDQFYGTFNRPNLRLLNKELLDLAFQEHSADFDFEKPIALRFFRMFEQGFNETHFDILLKHFEHSLRDSWVEQDVIDDAIKLLGSLRVQFSKQDRLKMKLGDFVAEGKKAEKIASRCPPKKKVVERTKSGDGLLSVFKVRGDKRRKKEIQ